jgi:hypothetical protein
MEDKTVFHQAEMKVRMEAGQEEKKASMEAGQDKTKATIKS